MFEHLSEYELKIMLQNLEAMHVAVRIILAARNKGRHCKDCDDNLSLNGNYACRFHKAEDL